MPSSKGYKRDYQQERKTAMARGETGKGSSSGDATRHRARRKLVKEKGGIQAGYDVDHKTPVAKGGGNGIGNLRVRSAHSNRSAGGKMGSKEGKAAGGRKKASK